VPLAIVLGGLMAGLWGPGVAHTATGQSEGDLRGNVKSFASAYALIEENFADAIAPDKAIYEGAIPGMLRTLDPHSNFLDPEEYRLLQQNQRGQYYGVGMEVMMDGPHVVVVQAFPDSPAARAGLRRGDVIAAVDDHDVEGEDSGAVADRLKGPRGTLVKVGVRRYGAAKTVSYMVTRGEISPSVVDAFWVRPGIAYVTIKTFEAQSAGRDMEEDSAAAGRGQRERPDPGPAREPRRIAERSRRGGRTLPAQGPDGGFASRPVRTGAGVPREDRQSWPAISGGGAGEPEYGFRFGNRSGSPAGSRPGLGDGRKHFRQGPGAGAVSAVGRRGAAADYRALLHAQRPAHPARLFAPLVFRLLLSQPAGRRPELERREDDGWRPHGIWRGRHHAG
jgi:membrane-associated protease RseP (regulator of RpoE activity)